MDRLYPKATVNRLGLGERGFGRGRQFLRAAAKNFGLLQVLFLSLFAFSFGALYQQAQHTHNLAIAFVDYDQQAIGRAIRTAYAGLAGEAFPTLVEQPADAFPAAAADLREAVCATRFWAALYVVPGASTRLQAALLAINDGDGDGDGDGVTQAYNASNAVFYVWDETPFPAVMDAVVAGSLQALLQAAQAVYVGGGGNGSLPSSVPWPLGSAAALRVLAQPWTATALDVQATPQGSRVLYNSLVIILIMIQEFFYLGTINGLYAHFRIYTRVHPVRVILVRNANSLAYTLVGSLCTVGAIWAFRAGWHVGAAQFGASWMAVWLFAHLNFLTLDVFTIWLPPSYVPMALISWVVLNGTAVLLPLQLSPAFYRITYAVPARCVYQLLVDIWSRGCNRPALHLSLPVMFAYELVSFVLSAIGVYRRSHYATEAAEAAEAAEATKVAKAVEAAMALRHTNDETEDQDEDRKDRGDGAQPGGISKTSETSEVNEINKVPSSEPDALPGKGTGTAATSDPAYELPRSRRGSRWANDIGGGLMTAPGGLQRTTSNATVRRALENASQHEQREQRMAGRTCGFGPAFDLPFGPNDTPYIDGGGGDEDADAGKKQQF